MSDILIFLANAMLITVIILGPAALLLNLVAKL